MDGRRWAGAGGRWGRGRIEGTLMVEGGDSIALDRENEGLNEREGETERQRWSLQCNCLFEK